MTPAMVALLALLIAIVASIVTRLNVGVIAIALAWLVGIQAGIPADQIATGFPANLFLTLAGVTMLFAVAEANGTLTLLTNRALALVRGQVRWLPIMFFTVACLLSSAGPGAISAVALVAPLAMAAASRVGIPPFLMALLVTNGANAGALSPLSTVGVIANSNMAEIGLGGHELAVWFGNFVSHLLVAAAGYLGLGGLRLGRAVVEVGPDEPRMSRSHLVTALALAGWILAVLVARWPLGLSAFAVAAVLVMLRTADEGSVLRRMPWGVILLVSGMSVLIALLERTGGMELFTGLLARLATADSINAVVALVTGAISTYSSTSGVVLPAFLPTAGLLVEKVGGGDPLAVALSINIGSSLVDVSPLSTLGALCVATAADPESSRRLFRQLMAWGLAMIPVGGLIAWLLTPLLARW